MNEEADFHVRIEENPYRFSSISIGSSILSSPYISNGQIYFGCNDTYFYALDLDGNKQWAHKTDDMIFSSPVCYNGYVAVGSMDRYFYIFSNSGELVKKFDAGGKVSASPIVVNRVVCFGANNGIFYALSIEDGKVIWKYNHAEGIFFMSPAVVNNLIIFDHMNGEIVCLSEEGKLVWKTKTGDHSTQTPLILDESSNELCSFAKRSLKQWPKSEGCKAFLGSGDGYFRCIDTSDGRVLWKVFSNRMGSSNPTFFENTIMYGSQDSNVYCITTGGKLKWKFHTRNRIVPTPAVHTNIVYCGSSDHNLYAIDAESGEMLWRFLTDGEILSSPVINNNNVFFASWDGNVYAIDLKTKELLWKFKTAIANPSYIKKPTTVGGQEEQKKIKFTEPSTLQGYQVKSKNYSSVTGELTNQVYTAVPAYRGKKHSYDVGTGPYNR